ncbi:MAG: response regulator [Anaerolineales bacterium]|nr:response regulator [Anaerolineales bacterium]
MNATSSVPTPDRLILVVEDSAQIRNVISKALEMEGYITRQGKNGLEGLELLKEATPDLILSDVNMPHMDGIEFFKAVRQNSQWTAIPFVFLTSHSTSEDIQRGRELGVEDYLTKPIDPDDLVRIINARLYRTAAVEVAQVGQAYLDTVKVLANAIESRDKYTRGHVERVTTYSLWMAKALKWPAQHIRTLEFGARLHDIGKIVIPGQVLNKPEPFTDEEWNLMKKHTIAGAKMLQEIPHLRGTLPYILYHHEKWDGSGYPKGLKAKKIPIQGRILALADVYDALTTARPYHRARTHEEVVKIIAEESGKHFDPQLVPVFIKIMNAKRAQATK